MADIGLERAPGAAPWIDRMARVGYAARGAVYVLVGLIALNAARQLGGRPTGSRGALESVLERPFGRTLLAAAAVGLAAYAAWKLVQAAAVRGDGAKGIAGRLRHGVTALVYGGLTLAAARLALGMGGGGGAGVEGDGDAPDHWTAVVMGQPFGRWAVALAGVGIAGYGAYQAVRAWRGKLSRELDLSALPAGNRGRVVAAARVGMAARAVVFGVVGWFLVQAALHHDPSEARGVGGALHALERQPYGRGVLAAVALGLVCYGVVELLKARYHRFSPGG